MLLRPHLLGSSVQPAISVHPTLYRTLLLVGEGRQEVEPGQCLGLAHCDDIWPGTGVRRASRSGFLMV
jgi:hypothetical protein